MTILGRSYLTVLALTALALAPVDAMAEGGNGPERTLTLSVLGRHHSGLFDQGGAEIVAHDPETQRLFVINAADAAVDVLDIRNPSAPVKITTIDASSLGSGANSIDVKKGLVAVAIEAVNQQENGLVAFYDAESLLLLKTVPVGALPDMLTFTEDGKKVLVANEGQPNDEYTVDPEGSVSIINLSRGVMNATVATAHFQDWNDRKDELIAAGVRIYGPNATVAQDFEPEYITISEDGKRAWVTLQENNALGVIDVKRAEVIDILPLGFKDHSLPGNELDASDRDGESTSATGRSSGCISRTTSTITDSEGDLPGDGERRGCPRLRRLQRRGADRRPRSRSGGVPERRRTAIERQPRPAARDQRTGRHRRGW